MSLKGGISDTELRNTIVNTRKGKKKAINKLSEYVEKGSISTELYNKLITEYRLNKDKKNREMARKIKSLLSGVILFVSMMCGLLYVIEQYGKGTAVWYIFLWIWAFSFALSN